PAAGVRADDGRPDRGGSGDLPEHVLPVLQDQGGRGGRGRVRPAAAAAAARRRTLGRAGDPGPAARHRDRLRAPRPDGDGADPAAYRADAGGTGAADADARQLSPAAWTCSPPRSPAGPDGIPPTSRYASPPVR